MQRDRSKMRELRGGYVGHGLSVIQWCKITFSSKYLYLKYLLYVESRAAQYNISVTVVSLL